MFKVGDKVVYQRKHNGNVIGYAFEGTIVTVLKDNYYEMRIVDGFRSAILTVSEDELKGRDE